MWDPSSNQSNHFCVPFVSGIFISDWCSHRSHRLILKGMVDYQHVPAVHADVARKKKRNWADVEPQFGQTFKLNLSISWSSS